MKRGQIKVQRALICPDHRCMCGTNDLPYPLLTLYCGVYSATQPGRADVGILFNQCVFVFQVKLAWLYREGGGRDLQQ